MSRNQVLSVVAAALWLGLPSLAHAQLPDIRDLRPVIMLLVDSSGSMESAVGRPSRSYPTCSGLPGGVNERNRWTTVLEALTGSWSTFTCTAVDRRVFVGAPDQFYPIPYHRPPLGTPQNPDGVLDVYIDRVKFGLMTGDATFGLYRPGDPDSYRFMVPESVFRARALDNPTAVGDYSYGVPRPLTFPGCTTTYMVDGGARNESAPAGRLVSVGGEDDDTRVINQTIQNQLLGMRPAWGTSVAGLLDDFRFYLANHPDVRSLSGGSGDPFAACRDRYAIVITDGQPNDPYRETIGCGAPGYTCPYERATDIAADLCRYSALSSQCTGQVKGIFVVGLDVPDPAAQRLLDDLADRGGTGRALVATDRLTLLRALSTAIDRAAPGTTTRTVPAFATSAGAVSGTNQTSYQFTSGFRVGRGGAPWSGVLDRTRYVCSADLVPVQQPIDPLRDSFHEILNARDLSSRPRRLLTVVTRRPEEMRGVIVGDAGAIAPIGAGGGRAGCGGRVTSVTGLTLSRFARDNAALTPEHFGITGGTPAERMARRNYIIDWVHGAPGTPRDGNRFGDIYHSSPVVVGPPRADLADESYNLWRRRPEIANRPTVVYVGTNDGILHAFAAEDYSYGGTTLRAGEEIWGFVPPGIMHRLESATAGRQILVDGVPVVRDVFYMRNAGQQPTADPASPAAYRTVLVMGLRGGGPYYFALDVSDPLNPRFLWQYTTCNMGNTFARPAIGQVMVEVGGVVQERAIALLPGGSGEIDESMARATGPIGCPARGIGAPPATGGTTRARERQRCWGAMGRQMHWVDMVTGETLFSFDERTFNAPLTGGVSLFPGGTGAIATRAYITDEDGVLWRLDFSAPRASSWTALPFHDIYWDAGATAGQPAYEPPVVTTDTQGNVVVIQGTGNIDQLDTRADYRVVSLTEYTTVRPDGTSSFRTDLNWEIRLRPGEQVTGPIELFEGVVYFGSFESSSSGDMCQYGRSRIWGVDYRRSDSSAPIGYVVGPTARFPVGQIETTEGSGRLDGHFIGPFENQIAMGVAITQQVTCTRGTEEIDPYIGTRYHVNGTGGGQFRLTAQVSGRALGTTPGASSVRTITRTLPAPNAYTRILSWVPQADR
jgi:type IV pilus assembly protein PilY1